MITVCTCNMPMMAPRNFKFKPSHECPIHAEYADVWDVLHPDDKRALMLVTFRVENKSVENSTPPVLS